jgi:Anti-sigma-K factor rskA
MSVPSIEELERQLSALPPEAWDPPVPPPPPWPVEARDPGHSRAAGPAAGPGRRRLRPAAPAGVWPRRTERAAPGGGWRRRTGPAGSVARAWRDRRRPARRSPAGGPVLRPLRAALASVALLGAGLAAGLLIASGEPAPREPVTEALRLQLEPVGDRGRGAAGAVALSGRAGGTANVRLSGLEPSGRGDFYELWLLGDDGELVSLGSVRVPASGRAELRVELPVDPGRFRYLDVSREPADGDPGHSADSVLRGLTRQ